LLIGMIPVYFECCFTQRRQRSSSQERKGGASNV
jgi:hypothetical protein